MTRAPYLSSRLQGFGAAAFAARGRRPAVRLRWVPRAPLSPMPRAPYLSSRLQGFGTTVFAGMSALAVATGSINLGQGFPDYPGPPEVLDVARAAIGTAH